MKSSLVTLAIAIAMGFSLSRIGFSSWDEVHRMFTFGDLRMVLSFAGAVVLLAAAWRIIARLAPQRASFRRRPVHPGSLVGGLLFGIGWAVSGACPSIGVVQLGEGQLAALWTLGGIFAGNWLYAAVHARWLRWDVGSCLAD